MNENQAIIDEIIHTSLLYMNDLDLVNYFKQMQSRILSGLSKEDLLRKIDFLSELKE